MIFFFFFTKITLSDTFQSKKLLLLTKLTEQVYCFKNTSIFLIKFFTKILKILLMFSIYVMMKNLHKLKIVAIILVSKKVNVIIGIYNS